MNPTEQKMKGMGEQVKGKVREIGGAVTGDTSEELGGKFDQMKGKARGKVADVAERADNDDEI